MGPAFSPRLVASVRGSGPEGRPGTPRTAPPTSVRALFACYSVLTNYCEVPRAESAAKLREVLSYKGLRACLDTLSERSVDLLPVERGKKVPPLFIVVGRACSDLVA